MENKNNEFLNLGNPLFREWAEEFTEIRRHFHKNPEIGLETPETSSFIAGKLKEYGADEICTGIGGHGVVAIVKGNIPSEAAVGLRADIDALPMKEDSCHDHVSEIEGRSHGCGHDGHAATLLAVAKFLCESRDFPGTAVLIFQPGEEGWAGAKVMIEDGLFKRFPVDEVYAYHNSTDLPPGKVALNYGAMQAAADAFEITVVGRGGHGSRPHLNADPILAAAQIVVALQSIVARNVDPNKTGVVSCCAIQGGDLLAQSVCPEKCVISGTARSYDPEIQDLIEQRITEVSEAVAAALGCKAVVDYRRLYPPCINTPELASFAADVAETIFGKENVNRNYPRMAGGEDFAFMLQERPGAYIRVGQGGARTHSGYYDFNDAIIPGAASLMAKIAVERLKALTG